MKELYIAPEAQLMSFVAQQKMASLNFDDLLAAAGKQDDVVKPEPSDVELEIGN